MKVEYHPLTAEDLNEAVEFYNHRRSGLGDELRAEVYLRTQKRADAPVGAVEGFWDGRCQAGNSGREAD